MARHLSAASLLARRTGLFLALLLFVFFSFGCKKPASPEKSSKEQTKAPVSNKPPEAWLRNKRVLVGKPGRVRARSKLLGGKMFLQLKSPLKVSLDLRGTKGAKITMGDTVATLERGSAFVDLDLRRHLLASLRKRMVKAWNKGPRWGTSFSG